MKVIEAQKTYRHPIKLSTKNSVNSIIQVKDLCYSIDGKALLKKLNISITEGEYISIIGPNGAGKSTFIKCISNIIETWTGEVFIHGGAISKLSSKDLAQKMSYVPQAVGRSFPYTVNEFVLMGRYPHLSPFSVIKDEDREIVRECLEQTEMLDYKDRQMDTLSGGERQMIFIAAALAQEAKILILDEPATYLDYKHQTKVMQTLQKLNRDEGITVISVNHDINAAAAWSHRLLAIKEGEILWCDKPENVLNKEDLSKLYGTSFSFVRTCASPIPYVVTDDMYK